PGRGPVPAGQINSAGCPARPKLPGRPFPVSSRHRFDALASRDGVGRVAGRCTATELCPSLAWTVVAPCSEAGSVNGGERARRAWPEETEYPPPQAGGQERDRQLTGSFTRTVRVTPPEPVPEPADLHGIAPMADADRSKQLHQLGLQRHVAVVAELAQ